MHSKGILMMRVLMNKFHQGAPDVFLTGMPKEAAQAILHEEVTSSDPGQVVINPAELFKNKIHYSWLLLVINELSLPLRSLVISSFPKETAGVLSKVTSCPLVEEPAP